MEIDKERKNEIENLFIKIFGYEPLQVKKIVAKINNENDLVEIFEGAKKIFEESGKIISNKSFFGRYYTVKNGNLTVGSLWDTFRRGIMDIISTEQGFIVKEMLEFFIRKYNEGSNEIDFAELKARFPKFRNPLDKLIGYNIVERIEKDKRAKYKLHEEIVPLIKEILNSEYFKATSVTVSTDAAADELEEIKKMDEEFENYLKDLIENRLEEIVKFGKRFSINFIAEYLKNLFGKILYFDSLLSITQQYGMADAIVVNPEGTLAMHTGFNLAFFGAPGTGKTFSIHDMIMGDKRKGVEPHGLPGRNRYCGGITAVRFIMIGEAYQGRKFNFIIPEFNDWFKYKGMVEPLKLAMEQRPIKYEISHRVIGPYNFNSFFSTNYNTKTLEKGYKVTISDPNFNAIEDRMLCSLHKMTRERFEAIAKSQRDLSLGKIKFDKAKQIRDHLTLVYAISTRHESVKEEFPIKNILLTEELYDEIEKAREMILDELSTKLIPFSARLERRALQLASAMSLANYFSTFNKDYIEITKDALKLATKFFVEEVTVRTQERINPQRILKKLNIEY